jgi:hypothetical protein
MTGSSSNVLSVPCDPGTGSAEIRYTRSRRYQAGAVDARDGITETQLLALRDAYFVALDASAILHDGTEQRRRIIKAMRRLRLSGVPFVSRMVQEALEDQGTPLVRLDPAGRDVVTD